jgi:predicted Zn-dependent protease
MRYSNPRIPEGINVSRRHPLREFAVLAGGALALVIAIGWLVAQFGGQAARLVPFAYETRLMPASVFQADAPAALQRYVDGLADRLAEAMDLDPGIGLRVHFSGDATINAFATLGGNIVLYRGLVERLPNENALAMLLAHEIAHVQHRDPIVSIGQGAAIGLAATLLLGDPNLAVLGRAGSYTRLHFSRDMERAADAAALGALHEVYGHVTGASDLFDTIRATRADIGRGEAPAIFSSHPLDAERLAAAEALAQARGWPDDADATPLPARFDSWMRQSAAGKPAPEG